MTKKVKISYMILVWSIVAVQIYINYQDGLKQDQRDEVVTAFSATDCMPKGNVVTGQGYFGNMEISQSVKKEMLMNLAWKLGMEENYVFRKSKVDDVEQMILTSENEDYVANLCILSKKQQDMTTQYIIVEIVMFDEEKNIYDIYDQVEQIFEEIGMEGNVHMELKVQREGKKWKIEKG